ncbi:MAG: HD domain-containing protein [Desulfobacterales bacterium]|nr:HD domain-containing protein [Desulfobacterales bacterium]
MRSNKGTYINKIRDGRAVTGLFLVKEVSRAETKNGKPYLILTLMDSSGEIGARLWENVDRLQPSCPAGGIIAIHGQAQAYKGVVQLKIDTLEAVDAAAVDMGLFLPATDLDIPAMIAELQDLVKGVTEPFLKKLLQAFFQDPAFLDRFQQAPAAKSIHHAYLGGLLEHTLAVARLAGRIVDLYPGLDRSLLLSGALLHDIGKVEEFSYDVYPFNYTDQGRLVGHLVLGAEMVGARAIKIRDFPRELLVRVQHLVLSHHGQHEFGSPTLPMISEAFVLNFIDDLDAKLNYIGQLEGRLSEPGYQWTDFQRILERFLFLRGRGQEQDPSSTTAAELPEDSGNAPQETRQQKLFGL